MDNLARTALAEGKYVAYTDGSCIVNPGPGGCAYRLFFPDDREPIEGTRQSLDTTNNVAEMQALSDALAKTPIAAEVLVCLDSEYVKNGVELYLPTWRTNNWKKTNKKPVQNRAKWEQIAELIDARTVTFHKIKAHSGDRDNEQVDTLAHNAARAAMRRRNAAIKQEGLYIAE